MTNPEKINLEIDKQINAGFQPSEIRSNLLALNFTEAEINDVLNQRGITAAQIAAKPAGKTGVLSLLVSIFFIISGLMRVSTARSGSMLYTWGFILIFVGIIGAIIKGVDMSRK